jgi:hypothetical protein
MRDCEPHYRPQQLKFHEIIDFALSSRRCESSVKNRKANLRADVSGIKLLRQRRGYPIAWQDVQRVPRDCYRTVGRIRDVFDV